MSLQEEDRDILEKIRIELKSDKPLEFLDYSNKHDFGYSYKNQYRLLFFSSHMCATLKSIGMVPNKSLVLKFPDIPEHLFSHFIRGYYDGDGSIYRHIKTENNKPITITITSTNDFCQSIKEICENTLDLHPSIYDASCHNGVTKVLTFSGRNICKKFLDWLYADADLFLQRKYDRYVEYYDLAA